MRGFVVVSTERLIEALGEDKVNNILSTFSCPLNLDVEDFLLHKAILSGRQGFSVTHLVFASFKDEPILVGYFTLANKVLVISKSCKMSESLRKRISRFSTFNQLLDQREISAPLIAQLGKNFNHADKKLISGDELLELATDVVRQSLMLLGGRVAYLECEKHASLINFYKRNGFIPFNERPMDFDEKKLMKGDSLVQLIKYFRSEDFSEIRKIDTLPQGFSS